MHDGEIVDGTERLSNPIESAEALVAISSAEMDTQIATAKRYPRSVKGFQDEALSLATLNERIAGECFYAVPRSGKMIEGPSVRLAEILLSSWGNCRGGARIVAQDDKFITAQGVFIDLQRNASIVYEVRRRITDRNGKTFNADMIAVAGNAACSIAMRNSVLRGIPKAFWIEVFEAAKRCAVGDVKTLIARRTQALTSFAKMHVTPDMIFAKLGVAGEQDITLDHFATLLGLYNAIRDGDTDVDAAFGVEQQTGAKVRKSKTADILDAATNGAPTEADLRRDGLLQD